MTMIARVLTSLLMLVSLLDTAGEAAPGIRMVSVVPAAVGTCEAGEPQVHLTTEHKRCWRDGMPAAVVPCPDQPAMPASSDDPGAWSRWWLPIDFRSKSPRDTIPDRILDPPRLAAAT